MKQENLNPEIEEKLLQLQRYQERQMREGKDPTITTTINSGVSTNSQVASSINTISNVSSSRLTSRRRPASIPNSTSSKDQEGNESISPPGSSNRRKVLRIENKELKSVYDLDYSTITTVSIF